MVNTEMLVVLRAVGSRKFATLDVANSRQQQVWLCGTHVNVQVKKSSPPREYLQAFS
jgi:hypothetical protein